MGGDYGGLPGEGEDSGEGYEGGEGEGEVCEFGAVAGTSEDELPRIAVGDCRGEFAIDTDAGMDAAMELGCGYYESSDEGRVRGVS